MRGVAIVGRPRGRLVDAALVVEVLRVATDGVSNGCSMLYGACCRAARALGYEKAITYTLASEPGTSLEASGWTRVAECRADDGDRPSRPRPRQGKMFGLSKDETKEEPKVRWEKVL